MAQTAPARDVLAFCPHIQSNRPRGLQRLNDSPPQRKAVKSSARAAAWRSTALTTGLALAVGLSAMSVEAWAKPKVPLPKPRPIARNAVPRTTPAAAAARTAAVAPTQIV